MRLFITGATGFIGSALVPQLQQAGHQVTALARSKAAAAALTAAGVQVKSGSLDDLKILKEAAADSDGVIHLAFRHDIAFSGGFQEAADSDLRAVQTFGEALAGSDRPLIIAGGLMGLKPGQIATERDFPAAGNPMVSARAVTAQVTLALANQGVRSSVIRLAPTNHGEGDHGFIAQLISIARAKGSAGYIGDGTQRWPAAHRTDAASLFTLAVEKAPAGSVLHGAAEEGVQQKDIAAAIGRHLNLPVVSVAAEQAGEHFGWLAAGVSVDSPASSAITHNLVGWQSTQPGLIADLDQGHYFQF